MSTRFEVVFLPAAQGFVEAQPDGIRSKIYQVCQQASEEENIKFFKELREDIWEFRIQHLGDHFRLFAFWEPSCDGARVLVTHGWHKKEKKTPEAEIQQALEAKAEYEGQNQ